MTYQFRLREEPFEFYPQFDNAEESLTTDFAETWQGEVSRKSPDYVRWVQRSLNQILGLQLAVDGDLGSQTRSAIRSFQQRQGLKVDGSVGSQTESALIAAGATPLPLSGIPPEPQEPPMPVPPTPLARRCRFGFSPRRVEVPGGGRIKDKTPPNPNDLVQIEGVGSRRIPLQRLAAEAWKALVGAARSNGILHPLLLPTSGFRDPEHQRRLWEQAKLKYGSAQAARKWVAPPGSSPHQSGRAIDFYLGGKNSSGNVTNLRRLPAYKWLVENAECFGFYPYEAEPWHWEYNPPSTPPNELQELEGFYAEPGELEREPAVDRNRPEHIRWVQQSLNRILGLRLPTDGTLGTQTRSAIRSFQERKGLWMDGILGPETQQALGLARKRIGRVDLERTKHAYKGPFASADYETEVVEAAALGLAAVQFGRDLLTSGDFSSTSSAISYTHPNTPLSQTYRLARLDFRIFAVDWPLWLHPAGRTKESAEKFGEKFWFTLEWEYNGNDIRDAGIHALPKRSSSLYIAEFSIQFSGAAYSHSQAPVAEIVFTIGGTWDPADFFADKYSFRGKLFVKADGSWPRLSIPPDQDAVWFDKFYPVNPPLPLLPYRPTIPTRTTHPELKRGSQGDAVRQVQQLLNRWGASAQPPVALDADGKFGKDTQKVVKAFQRWSNLDVDGVVGTRTWQALLAFK